MLSGVIGNFPLLFPSSTLDTFLPGGLIFWCHIFLPFHTAHGVLRVRILEWFAIPSYSGPCFVRTLYFDPSTLDGPVCMACSFTELCKPLRHDKDVIHEGM